MDDLRAALGAVGPRLRALREQRGATLADVAAATGISVSTLSRLESGVRRPTIEHLLPLARLHEVTIDELVDAPAGDDPRVPPHPTVRHGVTYVPLSRRSEGPRSYRMSYPPRTPPEVGEPRVHDGYEWVYVLTGTLRLVLGGRALDLVAGEAAEFDTRVPHWLGNVSDAPTEVLALYGPQGERMHVRARPRRVEA
ncbi:helix-turn-helix domain-containing protein [Cellulomonas wangsupingiae]|uniref:XRE family transcriptional regulator n=1 Tax=Cellulomonas wangsupingiae TaxID=2968085 RepID=A0ABY5K3M6_9CELL|nr:XRE family transcriptional regulator [Cellulomonas wangsupingiae]MCC2336180.1 XRE family transcriptional regulator [Cellulomonas wangsupingiae]MCM0641572.1 XRE family transcriptional regulator [Cellulomonas wangsupingiae]UUI64575.1 XRE family transcriptional regulator [Cellulomonas wangsupingiae]